MLDFLNSCSILIFWIYFCCQKISNKKVINIKNSFTPLWRAKNNHEYIYIYIRRQINESGIQINQIFIYAWPDLIPFLCYITTLYAFENTDSESYIKTQHTTHVLQITCFCISGKCTSKTNMSSYAIRRRFANIFIKAPEKSIGKSFASYLWLLYFQFIKLIQNVKSQQALWKAGSCTRTLQNEATK